MKCTNGVDGVSTEEDGANVCTPNEFAPETKRLSFKADSRSPLSDMQMQRHTIEVFKHLRRKKKKKQSADSFQVLVQKQYSTTYAVATGDKDIT